MFLSCNLNMFLYLTFNDDFELNGKRMKGIYLGKGGTSVTWKLESVTWNEHHPEKTQLKKI